MFKYLSHTEIDKQKWDAGVSASVNKNIFAYSWFLDAVCPQWAAVTDEHYRVLLPLPTRKKMGLTYVFQPYFTQQLGAFFSEEKEAYNILKAIPSFYRYIELKINRAFQPDLKGFEVKENDNYTLSLTSDYESLFHAFGYNTRRNIKKCPPDLSVVYDFDDRQAVDMFSKNRGARLSNYKLESTDVLFRLLKVLRERSSLEKWAVINSQGKVLAAAHFAVFENKRIFLFSATDEEGKSKRAMFYLLDRFIARYAGTDLILDFSGSNDPQLARFYSGFGSSKEVYVQLIKNNLPFFLKWLKR